MKPNGWYVYYTEPNAHRTTGLLNLEYSDCDAVRDADGRRARFLDAQSVAAALAKLVGADWMNVPCYFVDMWGEFVGEKYTRIDWNEVLEVAF